MKRMKMTSLDGPSADGLDGTGQDGAQAVKRMRMRGGCTAWLEFHLSLVYPNKSMDKEIFLTFSVVNARQGSPGKHFSLGSRMEKYRSWGLTRLNFPLLLCQHQYQLRSSVFSLMLLTKFELGFICGQKVLLVCILQGTIISEALPSCQIPKHSLGRGQGGSGALISVFCSREAPASCLWCCACRLRAAGAALPHQTGPSTGAADEETKQN